MTTILFWLGAFACLPKGPIPLSAANSGSLSNGELQYTATAILDVEPGRGLDLQTTIDVTNTGTSTIRVNVARSRVSVDDQPFTVCRYGSAADPAKLIATLGPGESQQLNVTCRDVGRPVHKIELKFAASGTGSTGEIVAGFLGLGERP